MNDRGNHMHEFEILVQRYLDGTLDQDSAVILKEYLYRSEYVDLFVHQLRQEQLIYELMSSAGDLPVGEFDLLREFAQYEKIAPVFEKPVERAPRVLIQKVEPPKLNRMPNRWSLVNALAAIAAVLLIVLFVRIAEPPSGVQVATLDQSVNAKWADTEKMAIGQRFITGSTNYLLREGCAELLFDNQARITVEGPAEFQILTSDQIKLNYGRLYASISEEAYGFTVSTASAKIIDLGTEFGVQQDPYGNTELHVIKGRTNFIANTQGQRINIPVDEGDARKLSGVTGEIETITLREDLFVRKINSETSLIWKGCELFCLADVVAGGNGFGTGKPGLAIDPVSGHVTQEKAGTRKAANDYRLVPSNPHIDGVFVPNGRTQQVISSQGHLFQECPITNGLSCENIASVRMDISSLVSLDAGTSVSSCLLLHANAGITFDLEVIREFLPGVEISRFQSKCGIRKWALRPDASNADFWVLVDGKLKYKKEQVKIGELHPIDIELSQGDRFLTLIETDGGDPEGRTVDGEIRSANDSDWGIFVDPVLLLK
jgi:hypothetical protein